MARTKLELIYLDLKRSKHWEGTNMSNASFVSANALRSAVIPSAHTTNKPSTWHTAKPAFYAAFYAGYEANGGSIE
jgi:hypothetical protein